MNKLIRKVESKHKNVIRDVSDYDVISSRNKQIMGIVLINDILILDTKDFSTSRAKINNLIYVKGITFFKYNKKIDKIFLEKYFQKNNDNPFAVQHVFNILLRNKDINEITQFPPLMYKKENLSKRIELYKKNVQAGDTIFTFDNDSNISRIIRMIDRGHWSHCGIVNKKLNICHMTTTGFSETSINEFIEDSTDFAIYRLKNIKLNYSKLDEEINKLLNDNIKYGWFKLILTFFVRKFRLHIRCPITLAQLIDSNKYELIMYI